MDTPLSASYRACHLKRAVNHSGDSDSTGLIAGHLLGIQMGPEAIPLRWLDSLELCDVLEQVAQDIECVSHIHSGDLDYATPDEALARRYPSQ